MELLLAAKTKCLLVGTHRFGANAEYVFQVEDPAAFDAVIERWRAEGQPFAFEALASPGWSYFDEHLRPDDRDRAFMVEREVLERLRLEGSQFDQPHDLEHVFLGVPAQLNTIAEALGERGFRLVERDEAKLVMARPVLIKDMDVTGTTVPLRRLAEAVGATYDGWSCEVVRAKQ
jgi:hypothetical protein